MAMRAEDLLREALSLSECERAGLASDLLASLGGLDDEPEPVEAEWAEELRRRVDAIEAGTATSEPWETARERLLAKFSQR